MDIPPLAGKTAALSLGALPLSYALNYVSALSQCVRGGARADSGAGVGGQGGLVVAGREDARRLAWLSQPSVPAQLWPGGRGLGQNSPHPHPVGSPFSARQGARAELPTPSPSRKSFFCLAGGCVLGVEGAPGTFRAWGERLRSRAPQRAGFWRVSGVFPGLCPAPDSPKSVTVLPQIRS